MPRATVPAASVVVIDDEIGPEARFLRPLLQYVSLEDGGPPAFRVTGPRFDVTGDDRRFPRALPITPARFERRLGHADAIWPLRIAPWMTPIVARLAEDEGCPSTLEGHFLLAHADPDGHPHLACVPYGGAHCDAPCTP